MGLVSYFVGKTAPGRYVAAKNALVAKYMFESLGEDEKQKVDTKILELLIKRRIPASEAPRVKAGLKETQYYGMAAAAMAALKIKPGLTNVLYRDWWENVHNPLAALTNAEKEIELACNEIRRKHQIVVTVRDANR
jgi:hypothetical protein